MRRKAILLTKYVFSAIYALIWSKILVLLCQPAINGLSLWRLLFVAAVIAGACILFMLAGIHKFVGTDINPHTYSIYRDSVFGLLFNSLVYFVISGLLICLILWKAIFLNFEQIIIDFDTLFWNGYNGFFLDLPVYLVLFVFFVRYGRTDLSRRLLNDQGCVFDSWW